MPVPPVVTTASTSGRASRSTSSIRMRDASSLTMPLSTTSCPASRSNSSTVSPPVSVSGVRVSLMVSTATRTRSGADSRCLWTLSLKGTLPAETDYELSRSRSWSVARVHSRLVREGKEPLSYAPHQYLHVPAEQVRPSHAPREQRIPREHHTLALDVERQVPRRMSRRVERFEPQAADLQDLFVFDVAVDGRHLAEPETHHNSLGRELLQHRLGLGVHQDRAGVLVR